MDGPMMLMMVLMMIVLMMILMIMIVIMMIVTMMFLTTTDRCSSWWTAPWCATMGKASGTTSSH